MQRRRNAGSRPNGPSLDQQAERRTLQESLAIGLRQLDAGQTFDGATVVRELRARLRRKIQRMERRPGTP